MERVRKFMVWAWWLLAKLSYERGCGERVGKSEQPTHLTNKRGGKRKGGKEHCGLCCGSLVHPPQRRTGRAEGPCLRFLCRGRALSPWPSNQWARSPRATNPFESAAQRGVSCRTNLAHTSWTSFVWDGGGRTGGPCRTRRASPWANERTPRCVCVHACGQLCFCRVCG